MTNATITKTIGGTERAYVTQKADKDLGTCIVVVRYEDGGEEWYGELDGVLHTIVMDAAAPPRIPTVKRVDAKDDGLASYTMYATQGVSKYYRTVA